MPSCSAHKIQLGFYRQISIARRTSCRWHNSYSSFCIAFNTHIMGALANFKKFILCQFDKRLYIQYGFYRSLSCWWRNSYSSRASRSIRASRLR